jgi:hypothetical protein
MAIAHDLIPPLSHICSVPIVQLVGLYAALVLTSMLASKFCLQDFWKDRQDARQRAWSVSHLAGFLLSILSVLSHPFGLVQRIIVGSTQTLERRHAAKARIEYWIYFWAFANLVLLLTLSKCCRLLTLFPLGRLADMLYVILWGFVSGGGPQNKARAALFLLVHYFETVVCFASLYLFAQPTVASGAQAFRFSFGLATTLGPTDIVSASPNSCGVSLLMYIQLACVLYLILIDIPYILGFAGSDQQTAQTEKATPR